MAEASNIPTFKLVLVGDGGTGKVRHTIPSARLTAVTSQPIHSAAFATFFKTEANF